MHRSQPWKASCVFSIRVIFISSTDIVDLNLEKNHNMYSRSLIIRMLVACLIQCNMLSTWSEAGTKDSINLKWPNGE